MEQEKAIAIFSSGIQKMLLATICFTIMQVFVKELAMMHTFEITFFRSAITALFCLPSNGCHLAHLFL